MRTVSEHIRARLLAGVERATGAPDIKQIIAEDWDWNFTQLCMNRIVMGRLRYGPVAKTAKNNIKGIQQRLDLYWRTGNAEYLLDIANMAQIEFVNPYHPAAHFEPTDDGPHLEG
jgi:hypothetical protein